MSILNAEEFKASNLKLAIAAGKVPGWRSFRKFGMNPDADAGTEEMWPPGTIRVLPSAAAVASVVSDNVNDDAAGTGLHTLRVEGLDVNYEEVGETVSMDGTTPVNTTQEFLRVHRAYSVEAGADGLNDGNISISVGGDLQSYIEAGEGQTHQTHYTVPADTTLFVDHYALSAGRQGAADLAILAQIRLLGSNAWRTISDINVYEGNYTNDKSITIIPAKTEVRQRIVSTANNVQASSVFSGYLVDNDFLNTVRVDYL